MRHASFLYAATVFSCLFLAACHSEPKQEEEQQQPATATPGDVRGVAGIFDVPEMLALCKLDSAPAQDVAGKIKTDFAALEEDFKAVGAEADGPQGLIYYNNDAANFKFECLRLIKGLPAKTPAQSKVVVLEADRMLVYNHYGPYETSFKAYDAIRDYCAANGLRQNGPMREFYPTSPSEPDTSKWLTRIMVPVTGKPENP